MYNTVTNDPETQKRAMLYENQMDQYSRFEINLLCKKNEIPFDPALSPKAGLVQDLQRRNVPVPTREEMNALIEQHRAEVKAANDEKKEEPKKEKVEYKDVEVKVEKDVDEMSMSELRSLAKEQGINSYGMKKVDLVEALSGTDTPPTDE